MKNVAVVIPNWNGRQIIGRALDSLESQSLKPQVIVVENGSTDGSLDYLRKNYPGVRLIIHEKNKGFAGGVNAGIRQALKDRCQYVALLNNDAVADKNWLKELVDAMEKSPQAGAATGKITDAGGKRLDTTGDFYTSWGLPYPRGRGEIAGDQYDTHTDVFATTGGASVYRAKMLEEVGLFDEDFFAYYEDVDLSFRAQLAGWRILYVPTAVASHQIGATSGSIKGFTTYQTMKNLPFLLLKNVPLRLLPGIAVRFKLVYAAFFIRAVGRGHGLQAIKGVLVALILTPKKIGQRVSIQRKRKVADDYIRSVIVWSLPPNARLLKKLTGQRGAGKDRVK